MDIHVCAPFLIENDWNNDERITEFDIVFKKDSSLDNLLDFFEAYPSKRINIIFPDGVNHQIIKSAGRVYKNFAVKLSANQINEAEKIKEGKVSFFFDETYPAINLCSLDFLISLGVSDVYLADDLCYNLERTHTYCSSLGVQTRMVLNRIPETSPFKGYDPKAPIWTPKDVDTLSAYIDVFEFDVRFKYNLFDVLFRTWFEKKAWNGDMREINLDLQLDLNDNTYLPQTSYKKMSCGRRCNKRASNHCDMCGKMLEISQILQQKGVILSR